MNVRDLVKLDQMLRSSWELFDEFLTDCLRRGDPSAGLELLKTLEPDSSRWVAETQYSFYAVAFSSQAGRIPEALEKLKEAYAGGYHGFWRFDPQSRGWGVEGIHFDTDSKSWVDAQGKSFHENDGYGVYERHRFLEALYSEPTLIEFVRSKYNGMVSPWGFEIERTPFCWLESAVLSRRGATCHLSKSRLKKGDPVYVIRYFNGSHDVPTDPFYVSKSAADADAFGRFTLNKTRYETDCYELKDFGFKVSYSNSWINRFWHRLDQFDLDETLGYVSNPDSPQTPYDLIGPGGRRITGVEDRVHSGTGGEFLDLLWVLIKCGFYPSILERMPGLPAHFPVALLLFDRPKIREEMSRLLNLPGLKEIYELLFQTRLTHKDIIAVVRFGQENPEFQKKLAQSLNVYEYHLYSNYQPGANWFFADFRHLILGRGGRLLYLLASNYKLIPALRRMAEHRALPTDPRSGGDTYSNSAPYLYQALLIGMAIEGADKPETWIDLSDFAGKRLARVHKETVRILQRMK